MPSDDGNRDVLVPAIPVSMTGGRDESDQNYRRIGIRAFQRGPDHLVRIEWARLGLCDGGHMGIQSIFGGCHSLVVYLRLTMLSLHRDRGQNLCHCVTE